MVSQIYPPIFEKYKKYIKAVNIITTKYICQCFKNYHIGVSKKIHIGEGVRWGTRCDDKNIHGAVYD